MSRLRYKGCIQCYNPYSVQRKIDGANNYSMLPFEFIVIDTPVSYRTHNKKKLRKWQETVQTKARIQWPDGESPINRPIQVSVVYYYEGESLDVDNMIKPILDALTGLIYIDDCLVTTCHSTKEDLNGRFRVRGMSTILAQGFCSGREFIHVKITESPNQGELQ